MGTIVGVIVGYALGTRAGDEGWTDFQEAWKVIASSEEVRDLIGTGFSLARDLIVRGSKSIGDVVGASAPTTTLRRAA